MMEEALKLDCGILLLESLHKMNNKDNLDLKIDQIKNVIYHNFNELEAVINKTDKLRSEYDILEKSMKSNMDIFYNHLRSYEIELKQNMQKIWVNLFNDLKDIDKNYIDTKLEVLTIIGEKDKCYRLVSRIFDVLNKYDINIKHDDSYYYMNKKNEQIGTIKKMKDKVVLSLEKSSIVITFKYNDDNKSNFEFMELLIDKI